MSPGPQDMYAASIDRQFKSYERGGMRWEFLVIEESSNANQLHESGAEGWELVTFVSPGHFVPHYFFKRELRG